MNHELNKIDLIDWKRFNISDCPKKSKKNTSSTGSLNFCIQPKNEQGN